MGYFLPSFQIGFYFFQISNHTCIVIPFRKFVFHIKLVVNHVGEKALTHILVAENGKQQQTGHGKYKTPPVGQTEPQCRTEGGIDFTFVYSLSGTVSIYGRMQPAVGHQWYMDQCQYPAQQQGNGKYDEKVARVDACGVGGHVDG